MTASTDVPLVARLAGVARRSTLQITTRGRKTGKPHSVPIWFAVDGAKIVLGTLNPARDWVRNAKKNPDVDLEIGSLRLRGRFSLVSDGSRAAHVQQSIARKYWVAWIGSWFGLKSKEAYEITDLR